MAESFGNESTIVEVTADDFVPQESSFGSAGNLASGEACEVGLSRQPSSEAADSVFDAALLPGRVGITEVGLQGKLFGQPIVERKLCSIVDGKSFA